MKFSAIISVISLVIGNSFSTLAQLPADTSRLLKPMQAELAEVVVTGTLKEVKRVESPVPVEVYSAAFFKEESCLSYF